jgi:phage FluMu protein Com
MRRLVDQFFTCPYTRHPLFVITQDGIEIKCKHCKEIHFIGRSHLEQAWTDLAKAETKPLRVAQR